MHSTAPGAAELFYQAVSCLDRGDEGGAEHALRAALAIDPELAAAHGNLGYLHERQGRLVEAEAAYRQALALDTTQARTWINFGALLERQKRFAEAADCYHQALAHEPDSPAAWTNLGVLLACQKQEAQAEACYRTAIGLAPAHDNAYFNLAYTLLRQGRYAEGWACLEHRTWYRPYAAAIDIPRWQGEALAGRAILIVPEGGYGDQIQFLRYAALLKQRGAVRVAVLCAPTLARLFASLPGVDEVVPLDSDADTRQWDCWVPLFSLPFHLATRVDSIPAELPYLQADPERLGAWAGRIGGAGARWRVGLVWRGNPQFENDADRSLPGLQTLAPLAAISGIHWVSLQKGAAECEAAAGAPFAVVNLGPQIEDFADTAAIIAQLDLVIGVDTAVIHLAGALGKPCWVVLPAYKTDWRWFDQRLDSPWYPEVMRLFRQTTAGGWSDVVAALAAALAAWSPPAG